MVNKLLQSGYTKYFWKCIYDVVVMIGSPRCICHLISRQKIQISPKITFIVFLTKKKQGDFSILESWTTAIYPRLFTVVIHVKFNSTWNIVANIYSVPRTFFGIHGDLLCTVVSALLEIVWQKYLIRTTTILFKVFPSPTTTSYVYNLNLIIKGRSCMYKSIAWGVYTKLSS